MIQEIKTAYRFILVMGVGAVLFLMSVMVPVLSSDADFSIYNSGWNGCSGIGKEAYRTGSFLPTIDISGSSEERIVHNSFSDLGNDVVPADTSIFIIGPALEFEDEEISFLHSFMIRGGILVIADDVGTGDQLLGSLNTTTRITGDIMVDLSYMKQPEFAVTTNISRSNLTVGVERLLMNYPSTINPSPRAVPVVNSSSTSWIDRTRNDRRDPDEPKGPFNIMTMEDYGSGKLIVLSEPSLLINQMRGRFDNSMFVSNIIDLISRGRGTLIIDESHRDLANPVQFSNRFVGNLDLGQKSGILIGITIALLLISTPYPRKILGILQRFLNKFLSEETGSNRPSSDQVIDKVIQRHPDWDRSLLERFVRETEGQQ